MRTPPPDLTQERLADVLAEGWGLRPLSLAYVPEGGGSHHWKFIDDDRVPYFVTVDDLDDKEWLGSCREAVFDGLRSALLTAAALRYDAGLDFVAAPMATRDGEHLRRLDGRYTASLFRFLAGRSHAFGPYPDPRLRSQVLDMIAALHQSTPAVRDCAPSHAIRFAGREALDAFMLRPDDPWDSGPFAEAARRGVLPHAADLRQLVTDFDCLVEATGPARTRLVITHGEPHPANVMAVDGQLILIDWDTVALAPPERDVSLVVTASNEGIDRYQQATGRELSPDVITLYRLRWYLDDVASAVRLFRNTHRDSPDTRRWRHGLARDLAQLPRWRDLLNSA
ncbi:MAG TPA: phosphotransferase [Streptosporangiaceae bacterium]|nr:phosphotransferase [Streptosporangiaceae bacterium]